MKVKFKLVPKGTAKGDIKVKGKLVLKKKRQTPPKQDKKNRYA